MRKTIFTVSLIVVISAIISLAIFAPTNETALFKQISVVIDAGHGLPDGGAVAFDGTKESDINLLIAQKVYDNLSACNINCIMMRSDENSIFTEGNTIHAKKVSDTRNRVEIANKHKNALVVSIHLNTFPSENVYGAQVFYNKNGKNSNGIAKQLQEAINIKLQSENPKTIKPIPSNVYLFKNIENDSILIECGFLTNQNDLNRLKSDDYQNEIAKIISEVVAFNINGGQNVY